MGCCHSELIEGKSHCRAQISVQGCLFRVIEGDLSTFPSTAVVNSTNETLSLESSESKGVLRRGGMRLRTDCVRHINLHGPLSLGDTVVTAAGELPCTYLIHVVAPIYVNGRRGEKEGLRKAILKVLETAEGLKCKSVSLPAIGTQPYAYPKAECAATIVETVKLYLQAGDSSIQEIAFVSGDKLTVRCFKKALERVGREECIDSGAKSSD